MLSANFWFGKFKPHFTAELSGYFFGILNPKSKRVPVIFQFLLILNICCFNITLSWGQSECPPEVYKIRASYNRITRVYIFKCDTRWTVPEYLDEALVDSPVAFIVAGGGGGGMGESAGGGGAGGIVYTTVNLRPGNSVIVHIGDGGIGSQSYSNRGGRGGNTIFAGNVALGGGGGGSTDNLNGQKGGSGGGGAANQETGVSEGIEGGYAHRGGNGNRNNDNVRAGGGGGGAGGRGADGAPPSPGEGGLGVVTNLLQGVPLEIIRNAFAAGGGSTGRNPSLNSSFFSNGGKVNNFILGGSGNINQNGKGGNGTRNTGSGGGAGRGSGGDGGTGVVVLRMEFGILPVNWSYVRSHLNLSERYATINWATSKEWENSHFEVERSISGLKDWEKIGVVDGMGWTDKLSTYSFLDEKLPLSSGNVYYRLKQIDFNLQFEYSKTVALYLPEVKETKAMWKVYPNPVNDNNFQIVTTSREDISSIEVRLYASQNQMKVIKVSNERELTEAVRNMLGHQPKGVYVLEIKWNQKIEYLKIIKN